MSPVRDAERVAPPPVADPEPLWSDDATVRRLRDGTPPADAPRGTRRGRRSFFGEVWRWIVTGAIFAALASGLLGVVLVAAIYRQARTDQTRPVDAIVVLGTAQYNGRPGRVFQARLDRALEVYRAGMAPTIVAAGGRAPGDTFTEAEAARDYLVERGVPADAILLENEGRNSWDSMRGVAALLEGVGRDRVLLVSDGFHLLRVKLMARDLGLTAFGTSAMDSPIRQGGGGEFSYAVREAAAVVVYLWRER